MASSQVRSPITANTPDPPSPDLPPPPGPSPTTPRPGDPPTPPRPVDPPPSPPQRDSPRPVRPKAIMAALSVVVLGLLPAVAPAQGQRQTQSQRQTGQQQNDRQQNDQQHGEITDVDILEAIELELRYDDRVVSDMIDVTVDSGVVTLSGNTFTLLGKRRAVELIGDLKGVRAVVDRLNVRPSGRSDAEIAADVVATLQLDPAVDQNSIETDVEDGAVRLRGDADSYAEKLVAENAVAGVRGVVSIHNELDVDAKQRRPDDEIKPEIEARLANSPWIHQNFIEVQVEDGKVTLSGYVGSPNQKSRAGMLAWVAGVQDLDSAELEVTAELEPSRRRDTLADLRNDVQIRSAVKDALLYDPRLKGTDLDVRVNYGAVSLAGTVPTVSAKRAAEQDASNTLGVRRVNNYIKVRPRDWPGDPAVTEQVREALARDALLDGYDLQCSSHFGRVYLRGEVDTVAQKQRAEAVAANVPGALDVINRVRVDDVWQPKPDDEIQEDVRRVIRWSSLLDGTRVAVSVEDGVVLLEGYVASHQQREVAGDAALKGGARDVINRLGVQPYPSDVPGLQPQKTSRQTE